MVIEDKGVIRKTTVMIVEDHPRYLWGLRFLIENECGSDFEVVSAVADPYTALMQFEHLKPDIIIMDIAFNNCDMTGNDAIHEIRKLSKTVKILVLTHTKYSRDHAAQQMGANAYLVKGDSDATLKETLYSLVQGKGINFDPGHYKGSLTEGRKFEMPTEEERAMLRRASQGATQSEIAQELNIAPKTISMRFTRLYQKLGVRNLQEAIAFSCKHGII